MFGPQKMSLAVADPTPCRLVPMQILEGTPCPGRPRCSSHRTALPGRPGCVPHMPAPGLQENSLVSVNTFSVSSCRRGEPGPEVHPEGPVQPVHQVQGNGVTAGGQRRARRDVPCAPPSPPSPHCPHPPPTPFWLSLGFVWFEMRGSGHQHVSAGSPHPGPPGAEASVGVGGGGGG